jgi:hypothetical protein
MWLQNSMWSSSQAKTNVPGWLKGLLMVGKIGPLGSFPPLCVWGLGFFIGWLTRSEKL